MNALTRPSPSDVQPAAPGVDLSRYSGAEKAAIILMALGEDAKKLWQVMDEDEIKEVSQAMASLGMVPSAVVEALVIEFINRLSGAGSVMGSVEQTQRMLLQILPKEKVDTLMEEIRGPAGRNIWDKLANVHESVLASYLKNEYPQTVAVVLAKIRPEHAAKVLAELPQDFAAECIMRMLAMEPVQREILEKVETTLRTEFMSNLARTSKRDSHELMADIFNNFDRQTESRFMGASKAKATRAPTASRRCVCLCYSQLIPAACNVARAVDKSDLALGPGASDTLRNLFSPTCPSARKLLKDEMASMGRCG
jgi:flagellar motor switch protein FliG